MPRYLALIPAYILQATLPLALAVGRNFEYEYVLLCAYAALVLIPLTGILIPVRYIPRAETENGAKASYDPPLAFDLIWVLLLSPLIGVGVTSALYWALHCLCSAPGLGFWMLFLWYPAWVLAHAFMHAVLRMRARGFGRGLIGLALILVYLALIVHAGAVIWLEPAKRLQHLLTGFWHGPIYDAFIAVDTGMVLAQVCYVVAAVFLLLLALMQPSVIGRVVQGLVAIALGLIGWRASLYPSTQNTAASLNSVLEATVSGSGYVLHYQKLPGEGQGDKPPAILRLARDTEFHLAELSKTLGLDPTQVPLIQIYVYPDEDSKKLLFGGGATDVTDVRMPAIHITEDHWPHPSLRHELVHAVASRLAFHGLGFHPNLALTEGLAVALAPAARQVTLDEGAAALVDSGRLGDLDSLFSPYFWTLGGERAYTVAGSFINFLQRTRGVEVIKALYAGKSFQEVLGSAKDEVVAAWKAEILGRFDRSTYAMYSEVLYRSPGVLHTRCPHSKADMARPRDQSVYVRMRQPLGWDPEANFGDWSAQLNPADREPKVRAFRSQAARLASERVPKLSDIKDLRDQVAAARKIPAEAIEDIELGILEADLAAILGDRPGTVKILLALRDEGVQKFLGDGLTREIHARLKVEQALGVVTPLEWRRYLAGWRRMLPVGGEAEPWIVTYLKLRSPRAAEPSAEQLRHLLVTVAPDASLPSTFTVEWYRILAEKLMLAASYKDAQLAYDKAALAARPAMRPLLEEHARRARFYAAQPAS